MKVHSLNEIRIIKENDKIKYVNNGQYNLELFEERLISGENNFELYEEPKTMGVYLFYHKSLKNTDDLCLSLLDIEHNAFYEDIFLKRYKYAARTVFVGDFDGDDVSAKIYKESNDKIHYDDSILYFEYEEKDFNLVYDMKHGKLFRTITPYNPSKLYITQVNDDNSINLYDGTTSQNLLLKPETVDYKEKDYKILPDRSGSIPLQFGFSKDIVINHITRTIFKCDENDKLYYFETEPTITEKEEIISKKGKKYIKMVGYHSTKYNSIIKEYSVRNTKILRKIMNRKQNSNNENTSN